MPQPQSKQLPLQQRAEVNIIVVVIEVARVYPRLEKNNKKKLKIAWLCPQRQHCPKIMKPLQSLPQQMAECLLHAQPDSVANYDQ